MKLINLNPHFVSCGGEGVSNSDGSSVPKRDGIGLRFDCPCGCNTPIFIYFSNPLDGRESANKKCPNWERIGEDFESLTLTPSILRSHPGSCGWHGFVTNGEIIFC